MFIINYLIALHSVFASNVYLHYFFVGSSVRSFTFSFLSHVCQTELVFLLAHPTQQVEQLHAPYAAQAVLATLLISVRSYKKLLEVAAWLLLVFAPLTHSILVTEQKRFRKVR